MSNQIEVRLFEKTDRDGNPFMIGSSRLPAGIKLDEVTFVVFYPEEGCDEGTMIIRPNRRPHRPDYNNSTDDRSE